MPPIHHIQPDPRYSCQFCLRSGSTAPGIRRPYPSETYRHAYSGAGGLMFAASVYNLILPGLTLYPPRSNWRMRYRLLSVSCWNAGFLSQADRYLSPERLEQNNWKRFGRPGPAPDLSSPWRSTACLRALRSGYGTHRNPCIRTIWGTILQLASPFTTSRRPLCRGACLMRAAGASIWHCFWAAFLTSLPQPIAAVAAAYVLLVVPSRSCPILMGFAAGADDLHRDPRVIPWGMWSVQSSKCRSR